MAEMVKSAARALLVLDLLTQREDGLTFAEITTELGIPRSSAHGLLQTMAEHGYLWLDPNTAHYRVGVRCWEAGQAFIRGLDLGRTSRRYLDAVANDLNEIAQLAILDGTDNVYIGKAEADQRLVLVSRVGSRLPAHATGLGKVLLADLSDEEIRQRFASVDLVPFTDRTITDIDELLERMADVRRKGYGFDNAEYTPGVYCLAVPVRNHTGRVAAAMSVSVPEIRFSASQQRKILAVLTEQAGLLSEALGYRSSTTA